jgi:glycosyltransferase involved in cell wall biosynthesis
MTVPTLYWILNGCGLEAERVTGGPVRFHEISRRWQREGTFRQRLITTSGGAGMLQRMGCELDITRVPAAVLGRRERFRAMRLWSYVVSAVAGGPIVRRLAAPDVVVTVSDYFCDIIPALALKRRHPGTRWIAWIHHKELPPGERPGAYVVNALTWRLQEWSFRRIARHADQAWVLDSDAGDQVRARLLALGMPAERIRAMRNGIDLEAIQRVPERAKTVDAVMVGVRPNKGMHDIIPVWEEVQRLRPGTTLRLMGSMSGEAAVLGEIRQRGLDRVIEVIRPEGGYLPAEVYYARLREARLLFAPSHEEGWGIAVCEAMACGLPVVAWDLPVYRRVYGEALDGVRRFDAGAMAAALTGLLVDPVRCAARREGGRRAASAYDWRTIAVQDGAALRAVL